MKFHTTNKDGRTQVGIRVAGKRQRTFSVGQLVLSAFAGTCPAGMECCHNNGDPADNRVENLRWDTHQSNVRDRMNHGRVVRGERNYSTKLSPDKVRAIRAACRAGELKAVVARRHGVNASCVSKIMSGESWWWVEDEAQGEIVHA